MDEGVDEGVALAVLLGVCGGAAGYVGLPSILSALQLHGTEAELAAA